MMQPDVEWIYRIDREINLRRIVDGEFRAQRWNGTPDDFPHKLLKARHANLAQDIGLFRLCFFSTRVSAERCAIKDFSHLGTTRLLRCAKDIPPSLGFVESWDDGFNEGDGENDADRANDRCYDGGLGANP